MPKFGAQIDTQRIPVKGLIPEQGTAFPSPSEGLLFHRTDLKETYQYLNGAWQKIAPTGAPQAHTHNATEVNWGGGGTYGATNVENALDQFANFNDAVGAQLQAHFAGTGDKHAASHITYAGSTNLAATNVEAALDELDSEKVGTASAGVPIIGGVSISVNKAGSHLEVTGSADYGFSSGTIMQGNSRLDQIAAPTAPVSFNGQQITNLASPSASTDAANKGYVDAAVQGFDAKESVVAATTGNITLSMTQTIDGVNPPAGSRVLVKDQTTASQNGIYILNPTGPWNRADDANTATELTSAFVFVEKGTVNANSGWLQTADDITLGTTALSWVQFSGAGQVDAGSGLTKTGNTLDVGGTANRITVGADSIDIASNYVGQTSITTLGTIATGTWNATTIALNKGGTGATDAATARTNLGVLADQAAATASMRTLGTGATQAAAGNHGHAFTSITGTVPVTQGGTGGTTAATGRTGLSAAGAFSVTFASALTAGAWSASINHGLASDFVDVTMVEVASGEEHVLDWKRVDANNIQIRADVAYAANALRVLVTSK